MPSWQGPIKLKDIVTWQMTQNGLTSCCFLFFCMATVSVKFGVCRCLCSQPHILLAYASLPPVRAKTKLLPLFLAMAIDLTTVFVRAINGNSSYTAWPYGSLRWNPVEPLTFFYLYIFEAILKLFSSKHGYVYRDS